MVPGPWNVGNQSAFNEGTYSATSWNSSGFLDLKASELMRDPSMVLLMHLNNNSAIGENATLAVDESGRGNNGTLTNGASWTTSGKFGSALSFDGSDDYVNLGSNIFTNSNKGAINFWMKQSSYPFGDYPNYQDRPLDFTAIAFYMLTDGIIRCYMSGGIHGYVDFSDTVQMPLDEWHMVTFVWNTTSTNFYVDGVVKQSKAGDYPNFEGFSSNYYFGNAVDNPYWWNGTIDEVVVYNRSLSSEEIADHYQYRRGFYQSKVYDAGANASWKNLTWSEAAPYGEELPNNGYNEKAADVMGGANMTGDVLLLHLNNDSAYGENSTHAYDFSGLGNNGTVNGNAIWIPAGKFGGTFQFDGNDDYIQLNSQADTLASGWNEITIMAWAKYTDCASQNYGRCSFLIHSTPGAGWQFDLVGGTNWEIPANTFGARFNDNMAPTYPRLMMGPNVGFTNDGNWHHLAATYKRNGKTYFYIDGVKQNTYYYGSENAGDYALANMNTPVLIGDEPFGYGNLNGSVDEVAIWNRSLSTDEILAIYKRGASNLKFQARSCGDDACSGESFAGPANNASAFFTSAQFSNLTSLANNRYFQWKALFETTNANYTPWLYNTTAGYGS
jgi:hypothetical protein